MRLVCFAGSISITVALVWWTPSSTAAGLSTEVAVAATFHRLLIAYLAVWRWFALAWLERW